MADKDGELEEAQKRLDEARQEGKELDAQRKELDARLAAARKKLDAQFEGTRGKMDQGQLEKEAITPLSLDELREALRDPNKEIKWCHEPWVSELSDDEVDALVDRGWVEARKSAVLHSRMREETLFQLVRDSVVEVRVATASRPDLPHWAEEELISDNALCEHPDPRFRSWIVRDALGRQCSAATASKLAKLAIATRDDDRLNLRVWEYTMLMRAVLSNSNLPEASLIEIGRHRSMGPYDSIGPLVLAHPNCSRKLTKTLKRKQTVSALRNSEGTKFGAMMSVGCLSLLIAPAAGLFYEGAVSLLFVSRALLVAGVGVLLFSYFGEGVGRRLLVGTGLVCLMFGVLGERFQDDVSAIQREPQETSASCSLKGMCIEPNEPDNEEWCRRVGGHYEAQDCPSNSDSYCRLQAGGDFTASATSYYYKDFGPNAEAVCTQAGGNWY